MNAQFFEDSTQINKAVKIRLIIDYFLDDFNFFSGLLNEIGGLVFNRNI